MDERYDQLLHAIYVAGISPELWPTVTRDIANACESPRAMLFTMSHPVQQGGFCYPHNISQAVIDRWAITAEVGREDPFVRVTSQRRLIVDGAALNGDDLVPFDELVRTRFYKEWWQPIGIARLCTGVIFDGTDRRKLPTVMSLYRSEDDPRFTAGEVSRFGRLLPHLSRSLGIMFHLRDRETASAISLDAMDRLSAGVLLVEAPDRVVFANRAAQSLLDDGRYLCRDGLGGADRIGLPARLASQERRFKEAIARSLSALALGGDDHFSNAILLPSPEGAPGSVLHVSPFVTDNSSLAIGSGRRRAIIIAYDLTAASRVRPELLTELFRLSPAEAKAAVQVAIGGTQAAIASRLGVSVNTLKSQLKAVYQKTQTHRQIDLLKLLLALSTH